MVATGAAGRALAQASGSEREAVRPLGAEECRKLSELARRLDSEPGEPPVVAHAGEDRERCLIRWLDSEAFDVDITLQRLKQHARWWKDYGMDKFREEDELDETGPLFECGKDRWRRPTLVARPAALNSTGKSESITFARRCVYTVQRCIERMPRGIEQCTVIIDAKGVRRCHLDMAFTQELISALTANFPGRISRFLVINNHWTMAFFWVAIKPMLDPAVRSKVFFCGEDFQELLSAFLDDGHPYFRHALQVREVPRGAKVAAFTLAAKTGGSRTMSEKGTEPLSPTYASDANTDEPDEPLPIDLSSSDDECDANYTVSI